MLCFIALTTTSPSTAIRITMISSTPISAIIPRDRSDLLTRHLSQRTPVALERIAQNHQVLHTAAQYCADHDPQR